MDAEPPRLAIALSALAGAAVWGTYHLVTTWFAGQPASRADLLRALANCAASAVVGLLVAVFLGPMIASYVPDLRLRDPHVVGFVIGALAWEALPFVLRFAKGRAERFVKEKR